MKSTFVLATADSRLHADIMMIRLRRAGISIDRLSAVFSRRFVPNSFFFWLRRPKTLRSHTPGESFFAAGPLQKMIGRDDDVAAIRGKLRHLGFDHHAAEHFAQSLWMGHAVLCVQAKDADEAAVAWHIFNHSRAEMIAVSGQPSQRTPVPAPDISLSHAWLPAVAAA
jgi:hypothetical protein